MVLVLVLGFFLLFWLNVADAVTDGMFAMPEQVKMPFNRFVAALRSEEEEEAAAACAGAAGGDGDTTVHYASYQNGSFQEDGYHHALSELIDVTGKPKGGITQHACNCFTVPCCCCCFLLLCLLLLFRGRVTLNGGLKPLESLRKP